ncbi:hypothetical protein BpHYR1_051524 [Brachionus plicatilis]|uniref:Uncharacterized protein n=1 Tax=Brachionus plicatilis TaxID=10195 RepID=A0A3M7R8M6_BRAPC|nr:hypothetical protein BpHYR1_051524 [Brachionus plicatilis]
MPISTIRNCNLLVCKIEIGFEFCKEFGFEFCFIDEVLFFNKVYMKMCFKSKIIIIIVEKIYVIKQFPHILLKHNTNKNSNLKTFEIIFFKIVNAFKIKFHSAFINLYLIKKYGPRPLLAILVNI